tara:strand:+ start:7224 stop:8021 length:798 start_codon:yes stop_codon:yes gene_type:complete
MRFEAVLLDLDGTILRPDQIISDDVSAAISNIRDRIPVCILTGRELAEVLDYASILRLTSPQACDGGSTIVSASSKKVLWAVSLSNYEICLILDELKTSRLSFFGTRPDGVNTNIDSGSYEKKSNWICSDWDEAKNYGYTRISAMNLSEQVAEELEGRLSSNSSLNVTKAFLPYNGLWAVDFTHSNINKGTAAAKIAGFLGKNLGSFLAVGDSYNDKSMLDCVGFSVAMGNAPDSMTASVDYIAPPVEEDGLAKVINEVVIPNLD